MKNNRRKLLQAMTLGGGAITAWKLPTEWSNPVVESVTLPAHGQTTGDDSGPSGSNIVTTGTIDTTTPTGGFHDPDILDTLAQPAYAGSTGILLPDNTFNFSVCITVDRAGGTYDAFLIVHGSGYLAFRGNNLPVDGGDQSLTPDGDCDPGFVQLIDGVVSTAHAAPPSVDIRVSNVGNNGADVEVEIGLSRWYGFLEWNEFGCGLDCATLPLFGGGGGGGASDRNIKDNFQAVDEQEILERVSQIPIEYWTYTDREHGVRHIGPMAQDFHAAFNVGGSDRHIHMVDANGVNLASIKALYKRLQEKDEKIASLEADLKAIKEMLGLLS